MVSLEELLERQDNIITRTQALAAGLSRHAIEHRLGNGRRWTAVLPSVYAAQTGPLTQSQRWRAAIAYGGEAAMLGGPTAASAHGLAKVSPYAPRAPSAPSPGASPVGPIRRRAAQCAASDTVDLR